MARRKHGFTLLNFSKKNLGGFTLIEILVVIAISAVLTGAMVSYSHRSRQQISLNLEKAKITQAIQRARSLTLAGFTDPPTVPPPCSYGLRVDYINETYDVFTYNDPSPGIKCSEYTTINQLAVGDLTAFQSIGSPEKLPDDLSFINAEIDTLGYLIFLPPNLEVYLFDEAGTKVPNARKIHLETVDGSLDGVIRVNINGQISFN